MLKLLQCEWMKLKRSKFLAIGILGTLIVPFFVIVNAVTKHAANPEMAVSLFSLYDNAFLFLMLLFAPMVLTILGAWVIGREYTDGTLKNIFAIPVSRSFFLGGKLLFFAVLVFLFMAASWLEILALAWVCSWFLPVAELTVPSALFFLMRMALGGGLLCMTQMPFLYLTIRTKGFIVPMIAVSAVSLVNVVLSGSPLAGFYPWSAAYFLAMGRSRELGCPVGVSVGILLLVFLFGVVASLIRFKREE